MHKRLLALIIYSLLLPATVHAQNSPWYLGLKAGLMDAGTGVTDNAVNGGFNIGYKHDRYLSTEVEYTQSFIDGETRNNNDWEVETLSVFAALRSTTPIKIKGKIGFTDVDAGGNSDIELSLGFGVGFWAAGGLTEIEYTQIDNDNLDFLSIGIVYFF